MTTADVDRTGRLGIADTTAAWPTADRAPGDLADGLELRTADEADQLRWRRPTR